MTKRDTARAIAERYIGLMVEHDIFVPCNEAFLASLILSVNDKYPLRLDDLAEGRDLDLAHDVGGILSNWNPVYEDFDDCWFPRYAK